MKRENTKSKLNSLLERMKEVEKDPRTLDGGISDDQLARLKKKEGSNKLADEVEELQSKGKSSDEIRKLLSKKHDVNKVNDVVDMIFGESLKEMSPEEEAQVKRLSSHQKVQYQGQRAKGKSHKDALQYIGVKYESVSPLVVLHEKVCKELFEVRFNNGQKRTFARYKDAQIYAGNRKNLKPTIVDLSRETTQESLKPGDKVHSPSGYGKVIKVVGDKIIVRSNDPAGDFEYSMKDVQKESVKMKKLDKLQERMKLKEDYIDKLDVEANASYGKDYDESSSSQKVNVRKTVKALGYEESYKEGKSYSFDQIQKALIQDGWSTHQVTRMMTAIVKFNESYTKKEAFKFACSKQNDFYPVKIGM